MCNDCSCGSIHSSNYNLQIIGLILYAFFVLVYKNRLHLQSSQLLKKLPISWFQRLKFHKILVRKEYLVLSDYINHCSDLKKLKTKLSFDLFSLHNAQILKRIEWNSCLDVVTLLSPIFSRSNFSLFLNCAITYFLISDLRDIQRYVRACLSFLESGMGQRKTALGAAVATHCHIH